MKNYTTKHSEVTMSKTLEKVISDLRQREEKGIQTYGGNRKKATKTILKN